MRDLLNNNSLFVGQLYEDKSLALRARDLISFTTDTQTVNRLQAKKGPAPPREFCRHILS